MWCLASLLLSLASFSDMFSDTSVDGSLRTKNFDEIYNKIETKSTKVLYSLFFLSAKSLKIARLGMQWNPIS